MATTAHPRATGPDRSSVVARARSCHSLTIRAGSAIDGDTLRRRIDGSAWSDALTGVRVWEQTGTPEHVPIEAGRPLGPADQILRAVLLHHSAGATDLVLVARRSVLGLEHLRDLAAFLLDGKDTEPGSIAPPGGGTVDVAAPEWGVADPDQVSAPPDLVPIPLARPAALLRAEEPAALLRAEEPAALLRADEPAALLRAAASAVLAWYSAHEETAVGMFHGTEMSVHSLPHDEQRTVAEHIAGWAQATPVAGATAAVGEVWSDHRPGERYRPFLAPPVSVLIHWERQVDGTVDGSLWSDPATIAPRVARDFAARLAHLVEEFTTRPEALLGDIELLTEVEARAIVAAGTTPAAPRSLSGHTIHGAFREIALAQPGAIAVTDGTTTYSYADLRERSARVAAGLRGLGAEPGSLVGVALDRTAELVVTLLGVLEAGCVYVPLDLRYPADRLRYTATDAGMKIVIGTQFPAVDGVQIVDPGDLAAATGQAPASGTDGSDPAYVIYTSGSTGRPKGVVVPHQNVAALVEATRNDFALTSADVWTFFHSSAFDFSVWEIWGCLLTGGRLVVVPYWVTRDTDLFYDLLADQQVTVLSQTPSAFAQVVEVDGRLRRPLCLRLVVFGGEPLDVAMLTPWFARHSPAECRLSNMFGITETTVHVTEQTVTPVDVTRRSRSVGRALPGWSVSVRDPRGRVLPPGASGEIYVGGAGVADGYLHRPELTAQRFVDDPYGGGRVYRSGDRGRLRPDGCLDHLGRLDNQVKVRGHRIELDEIRNVLVGHPAVAGAAVVLRHDKPGDPGTARIDAYVTPADEALSTAELAIHAQGLLPDYMMPATLTVVPSIPLTINGKVDAAMLPAPARQQPVLVSAAEVGDPVATQILQMWSRALNTPVQLDDNFFELGGNSLLVIRLLREMRDLGLPRVSPQDFYRNSVANQFIQHVSGTPG